VTGTIGHAAEYCAASSRKYPSRAVSIADAMRQGAIDRIEREITTNPAADLSRAHNAHSAVFAEVKVDE